MSEEQEPVALNIYQQYRRTLKLDRTTSRMKNKDWYRDALSLNVQLHCYVHDESTVDCYLYIRSQDSYETVGRVELRKLKRYADLEAFVNEILRRDSVKGAKAKSLGVIAYLAGEISFAGLGPEYRDSEELPKIQKVMEEDIKEVLEDKTVSEDVHAWKLFPYAGAKQGAEFAAAIAVPRTVDQFLTNLRKIGNTTNFPIRTSALSAPLVATASLPWCASANPNGTVAIINYVKFTLLAFFNGSCDLVMLRHIPHAQGAKVPRNLGPMVFSAATSYELEDPEIYVFPFAGENMERVVVSLQTALKGSDVMLVDTGDILRSRGISEDIPMEMMTATQEQDPSVYPLAGNTTFSQFRDQQWPYQDFLSASKVELSEIPDAKAMWTLKMSRYVKMAAVLVLMATFAWMGIGVAGKISSEAWHYKSESAAAEKLTLQQQAAKYQKWDGLMKDRSKGWVCLEFYNALVPDDGSMVLSGADYTAGVQGGVGRGRAPKMFVRTWVIKGSTDEKGLLSLEDYNAVNGKKIKELFRSVAEKTGNSAYLPDVHDRDLNVKFSRTDATARRGRNSSEENKLPFNFTLTITQSFSDSDPLALK